MSRSAQCSACGAELSPDASPLGVCPACLLKLGLSAPNLPVSEAPPLNPQAQPQPPVRTRGRFPWTVLIVTVGVVLGLAAVAMTRAHRRPLQAGPVIRFNVDREGLADFAISPDGRLLAYTAAGPEGRPVLWVHSFDSFEDRPLAATEGATFPFWSPDSRNVGFFAQRKLNRIDISSGTSEVLCDAPHGEGGAWNAENIILFAPNQSGGLYRVSSYGGPDQPVTRIDAGAGDSSHRWPQFLPDRNHFLYTSIGKNGGKDAVFIGGLDSGAVKRVISGRTAAVYADRFLLFLQEGMLTAQPFDPVRMSFTADARPVRFAAHTGTFAASQNGILVYRIVAAESSTQLTWEDRSGKWLQVIEDLNKVAQFSLSPDARALAVSQLGDIWLSDLTRGVTSRFTFDPAAETSPIWSPDGRSVVFLSDRGNARGLYQKAANGAGNEELLFNARNVESIDSWSADGRFIAYTSRDDKGKSGVSLLPLAGELKPIPIPSVFNLRQARFSPDGNLLAYVSDESGRDEIYIQTIPPGDGKWQVSINGGTNPRWRKDGRELFYVSADNNLMATAAARRVLGLELGMPRALFHMSRGEYVEYDVAPDGRFLIQLTMGKGAPSSIDVVVNWFNESE